MRAHEFTPLQLTEGLPKWATTALTGAALGTAGAIATHSPFPSEPTQKTAPAPSTSQLKADPVLVNQMHQALQTPEGKAAVSAARAAGMRGRELAAFLAQCSVESMDFQTLREIGDTAYFKKYDIRYNPKKAKRLGNIKPGDGERYIGRGLIQLTGRENYARAGKALGLPLEKHPELVERPDVAAKVSIWYWKNRVQPKISKFDDTRSVTRKINSGLHQLEERDARYKAIAHLIGVLNWPDKKVNEDAVEEMALPTDWDESALGHDKTFKSRLAYAMEKAAKIGSGSSRVAFIITDNGRPTVLKIAKNAKGMAQNNAEVNILSDNYVKSIGIAIPMIDYDKKNPTPVWIQTELAEKASDVKLSKIMRSGRYIFYVIGYAQYLLGITNWETKRALEHMRTLNDEDQEIFTDYANRIAELLSSTPLMAGDIGRATKWGLFAGQPVIIDLGYTDETAKLYR